MHFSGPLPPVSSFRRSTTLSSSKLIVMAPPARAMSRRSGTRSMAITCFAPSSTAERIAIWPTGPQPQIATVSVGWMSHWTAPCQPVGKMSAEEEQLLVGDALRAP